MIYTLALERRSMINTAMHQFRDALVAKGVPELCIKINYARCALYIGVGDIPKVEVRFFTYKGLEDWLGYIGRGSGELGWHDTIDAAIKEWAANVRKGTS